MFYIIVMRMWAYLNGTCALQIKLLLLLVLGRIPWPLFVQFCCPPSGTTLNLHESIDFCTLSTNSLVQTCSFFVFYDQTSTFFIKISAILFRKLHVIYSYCTSSSLLAGGLHAALRIFYYSSEENIIEIIFLWENIQE